MHGWDVCGEVRLFSVWAAGLERPDLESSTWTISWTMFWMIFCLVQFSSRSDTFSLCLLSSLDHPKTWKAFRWLPVFFLPNSSFLWSVRGCLFLFALRFSSYSDLARLHRIVIIETTQILCITLFVTRINNRNRYSKIILTRVHCGRDNKNKGGLGF